MIPSTINEKTPWSYSEDVASLTHLTQRRNAGDAQNIQDLASNQASFMQVPHPVPVHGWGEASSSVRKARREGACQISEIRVFHRAGASTLPNYKVAMFKGRD